MPVPTLITDLSTVANSNSPPGTESAKGNIDNYIRAHASFIKQAYNAAQDNSLTWAGTAGGTANALTLTLSPAITAIAAGQRFAFKSGASPNSAATTVAISGLTAIAVQVNGAACAGGEILANSWYEILVNTTTTCQLMKIGRATLAELGAAASGALGSSGITGAAASGANSDILSLSGLTTPLSVAQGGTGANTAALARTALGVGKTIGQIVTSATSAVATGTTVIPYDDTIPQSTEGDQYLSATITPQNASSTLIIDIVFASISSSVINDMIAALFQDSTANALAATEESLYTAGAAINMTFTHIMTAGTVVATTFKVRAGGGGAGTTTLNGLLGARKLGGVMASRITITEILP